MIRKKYKDITYYSFEILEQFSNIINYTSTRLGGLSTGSFSSFNLGFTVNDNIDSVTNNRKILYEALDCDYKNMIFAKQSSLDLIKVIDDNHKPNQIGEINEEIIGVDSLITKEKNICISILTADCVPILLYDKEINIIAAVHAGWKGTSMSILSKTIKKMIDEFNSNPKNIIAAFGPSISPSVYEIGIDVYEIFKNEFEYIEKITSPIKKDKYLLDLWNANKYQLLNNGVEEQNIQLSNLCTYSNPYLFYSARFNSNITGRLATGIMMI